MLEGAGSLHTFNHSRLTSNALEWFLDPRRSALGPLLARCAQSSPTMRSEKRTTAPARAGFTRRFQALPTCSGLSVRKPQHAALDRGEARRLCGANQLGRCLRKGEDATGARAWGIRACEFASRHFLWARAGLKGPVAGADRLAPADAGPRDQRQRKLPHVGLDRLYLSEINLPWADEGA